MSRKEYKELVKRVARIDKNAAQYMRRRAKKLTRFQYCGRIDGCFVFSETPQGTNYWWCIAKELENIYVS